MARARAATGSLTPTELARAELEAHKAAFTAVIKAVDAQRAWYNAALSARYSLD
jgi:hypothetical protein